MENKIKQALDGVRPALIEDGGDVEFVSFEDGKVTVKLTGNCAGCGMSFVTVHGIIERAVKKKVPEVISVRAQD